MPPRDALPIELTTALADRYRVERELGAGGMATVYLAHDLKHDRPVALKVLHPDLAHALGVERFQREIKLAARLQHAQILTVFDSGEAAGQLWYTMPFVAGETLRDRLTREKQLPVDEAVRITREMALALDYAHRQGVIHRDIKPENILLAGGQTLLADFGIGQAVDAGADQQLTGTGMAMGTAAYMSPEQASAERDLDGRTDIYSLAVVLYELLAGEPPFTGPTPVAILARALTERPRPIHPIRDTVATGLDAVLAKALATTRADRYSTAAAFAEALANPVAPRAAPAPRGRRLAGAGAIAVVLLVGVGGTLLWTSLRPGAGAHTRIAVLPFENLGDTADAYFVDGMTDAIRGKLTGLAALEVIDRESMKGYRKSGKTPKEIGRELEVAYLLTGTIRFSGSGGAKQVQVNPELVQVKTASTKWNRAIEAPLTDVFKVQGDIAGEVAGTLNVALGADDRRNLAERPTQSMPAYEAMLRGDKAWDWPSDVAPAANVRDAIGQYQEAVNLDPRFAAAFARLSAAYVALVLASNFSLDAAVGDSARQSAERAVALDPDGADGHGELGHYYAYIPPVDLAKALDEYAKIRRQPAEKGVMLRQRGMAELRLGRDVGLTRLREAVSINPRSVGAIRVLALQLIVHRHHAEALATAFRGLALDSTVQFVHVLKIIALLAQGDRGGAAAAYATAERQVGPAQLATLPNFPVFPVSLSWMLDGPQRARWMAAVLAKNATGTVGSFHDRMADDHWTQGNTVGARAYADSARIVLEAAILKAPKNFLLHARLGLMLAMLDRKSEAVEHGTQAAAGLPVAKDLFSGLVAQQLLARIYLLAGQPERTLDLLESLLKNPAGWLTPAWLRMDPTWAALKGNPRFERLVAGR